jgi:hypothetical protein
LTSAHLVDIIVQKENILCRKESKMRKFDYTKIPDELMNYELMNLVSAIHEYKGKQELFIEAKPDILESMLY